jgi:hypothetical protein
MIKGSSRGFAVVTARTGGGAGFSHALVEYLTGQGLEYSLGYAVTEVVREARRTTDQAVRGIKEQRRPRTAEQDSRPPQP